LSGAAAIAERLAAVRERIRGAALRAGRRPEEITLLGVSKRQPAERVVAAARAGLACVGENYVQEALEKLPKIQAALEGSGVTPLRWHFIGQLQRKKARAAAQAFDVVESVDRPALAMELDRRAGQIGRRLSVLLQVNLSGEPQKGGVAPEDLAALLAQSVDWPQLEVVGLMAIPALAADPERSRPAFARLRELRQTLRQAPGGAALRELSMGMSADFEVAIEEGATIVRIGTAIFGPREREVSQ
jgi:pyridoxal phosphate enzyme (YggS family)